MFAFACLHQACCKFKLTFFLCTFVLRLVWQWKTLQTFCCFDLNIYDASIELCHVIIIWLIFIGCWKWLSSFPFPFIVISKTGSVSIGMFFWHTCLVKTRPIFVSIVLWSLGSNSWLIRHRVVLNGDILFWLPHTKIQCSWHNIFFCLIHMLHYVFDSLCLSFNTWRLHCKTIISLKTDVFIKVEL